jgi:hypothetical protein
VNAGLEMKKSVGKFLLLWSRGPRIQQFDFKNMIEKNSPYAESTRKEVNLKLSQHGRMFPLGFDNME